MPHVMEEDVISHCCCDRVKLLLHYQRQYHDTLFLYFHNIAASPVDLCRRTRGAGCSYWRFADRSGDANENEI